MNTILVILGVGALLGFGFAIFSGEKPKEALGAAAGGAFVAGSCMLQLLIPVAMLIAGFFLLRMIFSW